MDVMRQGAGVEVVGPADLRRQIADESQRAAKLHPKRRHAGLLNID
jgi:hypothetical protein